MILHVLLDVFKELSKEDIKKTKLLYDIDEDNLFIVNDHSLEVPDNFAQDLLYSRIHTHNISNNYERLADTANISTES